MDLGREVAGDPESLADKYARRTNKTMADRDGISLARRFYSRVWAPPYEIGAINELFTEDNIYQRWDRDRRSRRLDGLGCGRVDLAEARFPRLPQRK